MLAYSVAFDFTTVMGTIAMGGTWSKGPTDIIMEIKDHFCLQWQHVILVWIEKKRQISHRLNKVIHYIENVWSAAMYIYIFFYSGLCLCICDIILHN